MKICYFVPEIKLTLFSNNVKCKYEKYNIQIQFKFKKTRCRGRRDWVHWCDLKLTQKSKNILNGKVRYIFYIFLTSVFRVLICTK